MDYTLDYYNNSIVVRSDRERLLSLARSGGRMDGDRVEFPRPTRADFLAVEAAAAPTVVSNDYLAARVAALSPTQEEVERVQADILNLNWKLPLMRHQLEFLAFARNQRSVYNASEQGTGKTRAALAWMLLNCLEGNSYIGLVVCPKSVISEWRLEIDRAFEEPPIEIVELRGSVTQRGEAIRDFRNSREPKAQLTLFVTNYEALKGIERYVGAIDFLVFDESWKVKSRSAQMTKAALRISNAASRVLAMSGTPIGNDPSDLWSQLRMLGVSAMPFNFYQFINRFCATQTITFGTRTIQKIVGCSDLPGLARTIEPIWFRATKASCFDLPDKIYRQVRLPLSPIADQWYQAVMERGMLALGDAMSLSDERACLIRLQQITGGHIVANLEGEFTLQDVETDTDFILDDGASISQPTMTLYSLECPKVQWLVDFARDVLIGNRTHRCIVWCKFNAEVDRIHREMFEVLGAGSVVKVTGATDEGHLDVWKESFNSRREHGVQVIVAQIKKLAYGHNLQSCDTAVYFSNSWSYVERAQSEDRAHRYGRVGDVQYVDLVATRLGGRRTIDADVASALSHKRDLSARIAVLTSGEE